MYILSITKHLRILFSTGVARSSGKKYNQRNECPQQCGPRPHPLSHEEKECDKEREIEENEAYGHPTDLRRRGGRSDEQRGQHSSSHGSNGKPL